MVNVFTSLLLQVSSPAPPIPKTEPLIFRTLSTRTTACCKSTSLKLCYASLLTNPPQRSFQIVILAILATRMHLHLWHIDRQIHGSDAHMLIPLTDMSSVGRTG
jgi:hypothetical protein